MIKVILVTDNIPGCCYCSNLAAREGWGFPTLTRTRLLLWLAIMCIGRYVCGNFGRRRKSHGYGTEILKLFKTYSIKNMLVSLINILVNFKSMGRARTSLIRDSLWFAFDAESNQPMIRQWVNHDLPTFDFWFDLIFWFACESWFAGESWFARNQDQIESKWIKSKWIKMNQNKKNDSPTWIKNQKKILIHFGESKFRESKWIDSVWAQSTRLKMLKFLISTCWITIKSFFEKFNVFRIKKIMGYF